MKHEISLHLNFPRFLQKAIDFKTLLITFRMLLIIIRNNNYYLFLLFFLDQLLTFIENTQNISSIGKHLE